MNKVNWRYLGEGYEGDKELSLTQKIFLSFDPRPSFIILTEEDKKNTKKGKKIS